MSAEVGHVHQRLAILAVYCRLGGVSEFAKCPGRVDTNPVTVDLSGIDGVAVGAAGDIAGAGVGPAALFTTYFIERKTGVKRRRSCKSSDLLDDDIMETDVDFTASSASHVAAARAATAPSAVSHVGVAQTWPGGGFGSKDLQNPIRLEAC